MLGIGRVVKVLRSPASNIIPGVAELIGVDKDNAKKEGDFIANTCWIATAVVSVDLDVISDSVAEIF